jgi:hypothetical protein
MAMETTRTDLKVVNEEGGTAGTGITGLISAARRVRPRPCAERMAQHRRPPFMQRDHAWSCHTPPRILLQMVAISSSTRIWRNRRGALADAHESRFKSQIENVSPT